MWTENLVFISGDNFIENFGNFPMFWTYYPPSSDNKNLRKKE